MKKETGLNSMWTGMIVFLALLIVLSGLFFTSNAWLVIFLIGAVITANQVVAQEPPLATIDICVMATACSTFYLESQDGVMGHWRGVYVFVTLCALFGWGVVPRSGRTRFWSTVLVLLAVIIAFASSSAGGAGWMHRFMIDHFSLSQPQAEAFVKAVRKTIHFLFYGFVGFAAWRAARAANNQTRRAALFGLAITLSYASFDEMRQSTQLNRSGSAWDVLLDMCGALVFVGAAYLFARRTGFKMAVEPTA